MSIKVNDYIEKLKSPQMEICKKLRNIIKSTFPSINEGMKYGVPYYNDKFYIVALKNHVNLGFSIKNLTDKEIALFEGDAKTTRHIKVRSLSEIDVFSASGFPDLENNFDGLRGMFKMWDLHNHSMSMVGEFYLTASETLMQPIGSIRKEMIQNVCKRAGEQVVKEGKIDIELMQKVVYPGFSSEKFQEVANYFWESLDGKAAYLKEAPKIQLSK